MSEKFMRVKKVVVPAVCVILAVMQLTGCGVATSKELVDMLSSGEQIEINVELPSNSEELKGAPIDWKGLSYLTDQEDLRNEIDNILGIIAYGESKNGVLYVNPETEEWDPNNTLEAVYKNKEYREMMEDEDIIEKLNEAVLGNYVDLDDKSSTDEIRLAAINAYFNIFPADEDAGEFNANSYLTRAQFMSGLAKAHLPAQDGAKASAETVEQIGDGKYSVYAELMSDKAYLDLASKGLNKGNINGLITRAEVGYMIASTYYPEELKAVDVNGKNEVYGDVKNAGDMAADAETSGKDQYKAANLNYMVEHPSKGLDEELYKAMVVCYKHGVFGSGSNSKWDEPITKLEALQTLENVYKSAETKGKWQKGKNQTASIDSVDLSNLSNDMTYDINGVEYTASQLENPGTVLIIKAMGDLPPITYLEWQEEWKKIDPEKYAIYEKHMEWLEYLDEMPEEAKEQYAALTPDQTLWVTRMTAAMAGGLTTIEQLRENYVVLSEEYIDEQLDLLYYDGRLTDEEKAKYEKWRGLDEPEVVYERPSKGSSSVGSDSSSSNFLPEETTDDVSGEEEFFNMRNNPDIGSTSDNMTASDHVDGTISIVGGQ